MEKKTKMFAESHVSIFYFSHKPKISSGLVCNFNNIKTVNEVVCLCRIARIISKCAVNKSLLFLSLAPFPPVILFCMAALIFPIGFYINEVGGQPYKLPNNTVVGSSYVLFVLSIFFTIVGLLFAGKVCLPG